MGYVLGNKSKQALVGVHPDLVAIVNRAIQLTDQDFTVYEGVRTLDRQKKLFASGASKTLDSMHIPAKDRSGKSTAVYGHAVDLVPWIDGQPRWEWGPCFVIAAAFHKAATELGLASAANFGGVWDRWMSEYPGKDAAAIKKAVNAYTDRRRALGRTAFLDGPHYQMYRKG